MAIERRAVDRAQRMRARRQWWDRNGASARALLAGVAILALIAWVIWRRAA